MAGISFSGLASGIDSDAIINATTDTKKLQLIPFQNTVAFNEQESAGLEEFNTKLLALVDSMKEMTSAYGGAVKKEAVSSNSDAVSVSVSAATSRMSTQITVKELAKAATLSFNDRFSTINTALASNLTAPQMLELELGQGENAEKFSIEISSATTLTNLVDAINVAAEDKLKASIVNVGTSAAPEYLLLINGVDAGLENGALSLNVPEELKNQGIFNSYNLEQASNSVVNLLGVGDIQRQSNEINDLIPGMTINLKKVTNSPVQLSVGLDAEKTAQNINDVVTRINELIAYSKENSAIERTEGNGKVINTFSPLAKTRIDENVLRSIQSALSDSKSNVDNSSVSILADLGITINRDGSYAFDKDKFLSGLRTDPEASQQILQKIADNLAATGGVISDYTRYEGQIQIALKANRSENESLNAKITRMEELFEAQAQTMKLMFSKLEATMSELNSQASNLATIMDVSWD